VSTIKVDTIQTRAGAVPKASDLGLNTTGNVLQVVSNTNSYSSNSDAFLITTSSTSFGAAALSASITPQFTSSKIQINISTNHYRGGATSFTVYRGSTNLGGSTFGMLRCTGAQAYWMPLSLVHLDSPNTTSAITYQLYFSTDGSGTTRINNGATKGSITAFEVGA